MDFLSAPKVSMIFDGQTFIGKNRASEVTRNETKSYSLAASYERAHADAIGFVCESSDGSYIIQSRLTNMTSDRYYNHRGHAMGGAVEFMDAGEYAIICRFYIDGQQHEASVQVMITGRHSFQFYSIVEAVYKDRPKTRNLSLM